MTEYLVLSKWLCYILEVVVKCTYGNISHFDRFSVYDSVPCIHAQWYAAITTAYSTMSSATQTETRYPLNSSPPSSVPAAPLLGLSRSLFNPAGS